MVSDNFDLYKSTVCGELPALLRSLAIYRYEKSRDIYIVCPLWVDHV